MTAPERWWPPRVFGFSITATRTSPSFSFVPGTTHRSRTTRLSLAVLRRVRVPARVDHDARRRHRGVAAERLGQLLGELEAFRLAQPATAGHEDVGALDVDISAALLAALNHLGLVRPGRLLDIDVDHIG